MNTRPILAHLSNSNILDLVRCETGELRVTEPMSMRAQAVSALLQQHYSIILDLLKSELDDAKIAFKAEEDAIRAGTRGRGGPRPGEEAYRHALVRFSRCLLDGVIPAELIS